MKKKFLFISLRNTLYPSDFPRRSRSYDQASWKCMEWRNMSLFLFHHIIHCLEPAKHHEKLVFLSFSFLSRSMRLPEEEYECVPEAMVDRAVLILNNHYEAAYGITAGTYNYHIVASHLKEIREAGPLTCNNAYPFESTYSEVRRCFQPGTRKEKHFVT